MQRHLNQQFLLLLITHTSWFLSVPHQWLLDLEPASKQLEASPPRQSCLQLAGVCKSKSVSNYCWVKTKLGNCSFYTGVFTFKCTRAVIRNYNGNFNLTHTVRTATPEDQDLPDNCFNVCMNLQSFAWKNSMVHRRHLHLQWILDKSSQAIDVIFTKLENAGLTLQLTK